MKSIIVLSSLISVSVMSALIHLYFILYKNNDSDILFQSFCANILLFLVFNVWLNVRLNKIIGKENLQYAHH